MRSLSSYQMIADTGQQLYKRTILGRKKRISPEKAAELKEKGKGDTVCLMDKGFVDRYICPFVNPEVRGKERKAKLREIREAHDPTVSVPDPDFYRAFKRLNPKSPDKKEYAESAKRYSDAIVAKAFQCGMKLPPEGLKRVEGHVGTQGMTLAENLHRISRAFDEHVPETEDVVVMVDGQRDVVRHEPTKNGKRDVRLGHYTGWFQPFEVDLGDSAQVEEGVELFDEVIKEHGSPLRQPYPSAIGTEIFRVAGTDSETDFKKTLSRLGVEVTTLLLERGDKLPGNYSDSEFVDILAEVKAKDEGVCKELIRELSRDEETQELNKEKLQNRVSGIWRDLESGSKKGFLEDDIYFLRELGEFESLSDFALKANLNGKEGLRANTKDMLRYCCEDPTPEKSTRRLENLNALAVRGMDNRILHPLSLAYLKRVEGLAPQERNAYLEREKANNFPFS